jgi:hypothetical protein
LGTITAGTIALASSGHIRAGQTAYNTGTGFFLGFDGATPKFSIGNSASNYLTWDGTNLSMRGTFNIASSLVYTAAGIPYQLTWSSGTASYISPILHVHNTATTANSDAFISVRAERGDAALFFINENDANGSAWVMGQDEDTGNFILAADISLGAGSSTAIFEVEPGINDSLIVRRDTEITRTLTVSGTGTSTINGPLALSGASAGQIVFPATQNASANANTLDDYEEGTFTPTITFGGLSTGITYTAQLGNYTKIGNTVHVFTRNLLSSKGSATGSASIAGLPFTSKNTANLLPHGYLYVNDGAASVATTAFGIVVNNVTTLTLQTMSAGAAADMSDTSFTNTTAVDCAVTYWV